VSAAEDGPPEGAEGLTRRTFLARAAGAFGALIAAVLGSAGAAYFVSPALSKEEEDWIDIGPVSGIERGSPEKVDFVVRLRDAWVTTEKRSSAWVLTGDGKSFTVYDPHCTHLGCPFRWDAAQKKFLCPCHSGVFDAGGKVVSGPPPRPLDRYPAKTENGRLLIRMTPMRKAA
jgi:menaquinol-cytochrome c reductase iron-sulfur subunit